MLDRIARQAAYDYGVGAFRSGLPYAPSAYDSFDAHLSYGGQGAAGNQLDLRQLLSYLVRYRLLIASFVLAGLCAGLAFFLTQTQIYRAAARIEISAPSARVVRDLEVVHEAADIRAFQTAIEKLKSRSVAERTVRALGLAEKPAFLVPQPGLSPRRLFNQLLGETGAALAGLSLPEREGRALARVQANLAVSLTRNTGILTISYADADPKLAMAIANQHAQSYIDQRLAETERTTTVARDFIENQVLGVKGRLQAAETALVAYAKKQGLTLEGSGGSLIEQNMRAINAALGDAIGERLAAESLVEQIEAGNGNRLEAVLENRTVLEIRSKIVELSATYQQNLRFFKADYPDMRMLRAQIVEYQGQLEELTQAVLASVQQRHAEAVAKEREIEAKLVALKANHAAYADRAINFTILKREVDAFRSQYDGLIDKLNEVGVGAEIRSQSVTVLEQATVPTIPIAPRLSHALLVSLVIATGLAGFALYLLELLNNAFRTPEQVEAHLKVPVLSALPVVGEDEVENALLDARSELSEAYRSLRTSLQFADGGAPRVLLVTSAEPGEGKTTTACKIASDFAVLGQRVLLVDADLRRPSIHRRMKLANRNGLSNILAKAVTRKTFSRLFHIAAPNLMVLTAGPIAGNPVDLLSAQRTSVLFDAFQRRYDLVVVDGPPVGGLSDAPVLSRLADATLLVVSARQVSRRSALLALSRLRAAGANVVGATLSRCRKQDFDGAYAYGYAAPSDAKEAKRKDPEPRKDPAPPRSIVWDYYGDAHVPPLGLKGLRDAMVAGLRRGIRGSRKRRGGLRPNW